MAINDDDFEKTFFKLKDCQEKIHEILPKNERREKDLPIQKLQESFALCSGAFYQLNLYRTNFDDLFDFPKNNFPHKENWKFFKDITNFEDFKVKTLPKSELIKSEFRSMCIANASFRLPSAGFLISDIIYRLNENKKNQKIADQLKNSWKYHNCLRNNGNDWDRAKLKIKECNCMELVDHPKHPNFFLALLICLRDEYGHSEYYEGQKCRQQIIEKYYHEFIVKSEIGFLQDTIEMILLLCLCHNQKKIDLCKIS